MSQVCQINNVLAKKMIIEPILMKNDFFKKSNYFMVEMCLLWGFGTLLVNFIIFAGQSGTHSDVNIGHKTFLIVPSVPNNASFSQKNDPRANFHKNANLKKIAFFYG